MENSKEIFKIALDLQSPWEIKAIRFEKGKEAKELHIYLDFPRGSKFKGVDGKSYTAYDTVERTWQHLNFFEHRCYIHARVPRVKDENGKVKTQSVHWARNGSGFTLLFSELIALREAYTMLLIESEMPVNKVAKLLGVYPQRIWNIFDYWIRKAHQEDKVEELRKLGFDETSSKKGHVYVTVSVDLEKHRVIFATEGKGSECIKETVAYLEEKSVEINQIEQVCIDMSPSYISGCSDYLPDAAITFDKFHVIKEVNKAMDELRKSERKGNELLKGHKYTFLRSKLTTEIKTERDLLMEMYPKLGEGYRIKELFNDFWEIKDKEEAEGYLAFWCDYAVESGIVPFRKAVNTIKAHWIGIINYIESKINNGILEGINSKIQLAKKRARGFRNIDNFINMIYFICGKLKFSYPLYIT